MLYRHLDRISVKSTFPDISGNSKYTPKKFRNSQDICKYDCSFEESLLRTGPNTSPSAEATATNSSARSSYLVRNEEIMRSLAELKEEITGSSEKEKTQPHRSTSPTTTATTTTMASRTDNNSTAALLRMKAETAAELYLADNDAGIILSFIDFYVNLAPLLLDVDFQVQDYQIVKAFNLFSGDLKKSAEFLSISQELVELGFEDDKVDSALILFSNDREAALDFLMKN